MSNSKELPSLNDLYAQWHEENNAELKKSKLDELYLALRRFAVGKLYQSLRADREVLGHDAAVQVILSLEGFRQESKFSWWASRVIENFYKGEAMKLKKAQDNVLLNHLDEMEGDINSDAILLRCGLVTWPSNGIGWEELLRPLTKSELEVVLMTVLDRLDPTQIAIKSDRSRATVDVLFHRAKNKMKALLKKG